MSNETFFATPQRLDREAVARQASALGAAGATLRMLDSLPDLVLILNRQRQAIFANTAMLEFLHRQGMQCPEGQRPGELLRCRNAASAPSGCGTGSNCRSCGALAAILEAQDGRTVVHECHLTAENGDAYDLRIWASPLDWSGEPATILMATDISDVKRRQMLERIFFHDLLNTASSIAGMTDLLHEDASLVGELKEDLYTAAENLIAEIRSQRLLVAAEQGELRPAPVLLPARAQWEKAAATLRQHEVAGGKTVVVDAASPDFQLKTDPALLNRVLMNLLKNALEAVSSGSTVTVGIRSSGDRAEFWCHNPSVMSAEVQTQVFQRSFSTKGTGRGLGTYSIRLLTERYLGGTVSFVSTAEAGTIFRISLPLA